MAALSNGTTVGETHDEWRRVAGRWPALWELFHDCNLGLSAARTARVLGVPGRDRLEAELRQRGLPPHQLFRDWVYLRLLVDRAVEGGEPLARQAQRRGKDPAPYYRFISRVAGRPWAMVLRLGSDWVRATALTVWSPYLCDGDRGAGPGGAGPAGLA